MRSDLQRLYDILDSIERIERYIEITRETFDKDELLQTWMIHNLQIIGEAAGKISESCKTNHSQIPWNQIVGMRHLLVHDYFGIDANEVWSTVQNDVPRLKDQIIEIISHFYR